MLIVLEGHCPRDGYFLGVSTDYPNHAVYSHCGAYWNAFGPSSDGGYEINGWYQEGAE